MSLLAAKLTFSAIYLILQGQSFSVHIIMIHKTLTLRNSSHHHQSKIMEPHSTECLFENPLKDQLLQIKALWQ